ncbi:ketopantoate reductase family protein [Litorilituus lipolyticus]|nr:2-dehydropantoate 2-reductase [Litorilituus lipolyticus]
MKHDSRSLNVVIIGQGAIGLLFYHYLKQFEPLQQERGNKNFICTTLLATDQHDKSQRSYQFTDITQQQIQGDVLFTQDKHLQQADIVLCCVKSYHVSTAIKTIANKLNTKAVIILAHNGMGTVEQLTKDIIHQHTIAAMLTTHGSLKTEKYAITHTGQGLSQLGLMSNNSTDDNQINLLMDFTEQLDKVLPSVTWEEDIRTAQWHKLAINCVINPLTAILNVRNGDIADEAHLTKIKAIISEIVAVAQKESVQLDASKLLEKVILVAKSTAKNSSSMRCDIQAKRATEIDYINGYICSLGEKHHIATPENKNLVKAIKSLN